MNYQWYPGHMTKAVRQMQEDIKLIDLIIEICDARIPLSSRNPDIDELGKNKARMVLLNKADLADAKANKAWIEYFASKNIQCIEVNSKAGIGLKNIQEKVNIACKEKLERDQKRGIKNRPIRAMVVGIPNVGKSTFINAYAKKTCTKTGNKPGVTKGKQWIKLGKSLELLDTPGILWPKFEDQNIGMKLAFIGSINDEILISEEVACDFLKFIKNIYPEAVKSTYELDDYYDDEYDILKNVGIRRGCIIKEGEVDITKASKLLIDDFRNGKLGRMTLEMP